ncbi:MAG: hypothetical protein ACK5AZ_14410 [Bryobacteraceae bacterium]
MKPYVMAWLALVAVVGVLALLRKIVAMREDPLLHAGAFRPDLVERQYVVGRRLDLIDKAGKFMTAVAALYGLYLIAAYIWIALDQVPG